MRLDFNVLWIDDQPERIDAQIEAIQRGIAEQGFEFRPEVCRTLEEVRQHLSVAATVFHDEIDMILVDWDLGNQAEGQSAIASVREYLQYKDVVFYSANTTADTLRRLVFENNLEGVYCTSRSELVSEVLGVFESLIKKVLDLDHARGIVMGATSDIDHIVVECLQIIHERFDEDIRTSLVENAMERISGSVEKIRSKADDLKESMDFLDMLEANSILTANDRLRLLVRALDADGRNACVEYRRSVTDYINDVVPKRNIMGHRVLSPEGKPVATQSFSGEQIDIDEVRSLRCRLLELRQDFKSLRAILRGES